MIGRLDADEHRDRREQLAENPRQRKLLGQRQSGPGEPIGPNPGERGIEHRHEGDEHDEHGTDVERQLQAVGRAGRHGVDGVDERRFGVFCVCTPPLVSGRAISGMNSFERYKLHGQAITQVVSTATGFAP